MWVGVGECRWVWVSLCVWCVSEVCGWVLAGNVCILAGNMCACVLGVFVSQPSWPCLGSSPHCLEFN